MIQSFLSYTRKIALFCACLPVGFLVAADATTVRIGKLEVVQEDNFETGMSRQIHHLHELASGKTYRLALRDADGEGLVSGATVAVQGALMNDRETIRVEGDSGISVIEPAPQVDSTQRNAVVIIVDFLDAPVACSDAEVADYLFTGVSSVDGLYQDTSFGAVSFPGDTDGDGSPDVIRVSISATTADSCDPWGWAAEADTEAANAQIDLGLYQHRVYALPRDSSCPWTGLANVGCAGTCRAFNRRCYIPDVYAHELGHNLSMQHSTTDLDNDGTIDCEYCDISDFMGLSGRGWRHVNGPHKHQKGWIPPAQLLDVNPGPAETRLLSPLELDPSTAPYPQLIRIERPAGDYYYLSYRRPIGYDEGLHTDYLEKTNIHVSTLSATGKSRFIVALADGEVFQDGDLSVTQVSHDTNAVTLQIQGDGPGCTDTDGDGVCGNVDNCPNDANSNQADADGDGFGDVCDVCPDDANDDADGDGLCADADNCPNDANQTQGDGDGDGFGDACDSCPSDPNKVDPGGCGCGVPDTDSDGDGIPDCNDVCPNEAGDDTDGDGACDSVDNCPSDPNPTQADADADGLGDVCDSCPNDPDNNIDGDNRCGDVDNCPFVANNNQKDNDGDGLGNACDPCINDPTNDVDGDGVCGGIDNCPDVANPGQEDTDGDGLGDACDSCASDTDGDGVCDSDDVCPGGDDTIDGDGDGVPDFCDPCPADNPDDSDSDGACDSVDICPGGDDAIDGDGDGVPDFCDPCPADNPDDSDGDGVCDSVDVCPGGDDWIDGDGDGVPDFCDPCPADNADDSDGDGVCDSVDVCPGGDDTIDSDGDGVPDFCDPCPADNPDDSDADGACDSVDVCPGGDDAIDGDGDGVPDFCDPCPADEADDSDGDGVCDSVDVCPGGDDAIDGDGDGVPDFCDPCPADNPNDSDGDGVCDSVDVCPGGDDTIDSDGDGVPDFCDPCPADNPDDSDSDGVCDSVDVCPGGDDTIDGDGDGTPDACDLCPGDPGKVAPGQCGCGSPDIDSDGDGVADCGDICPGFNDGVDSDGDGVPDGCDACAGGDDGVDDDGDGTPDSCDSCPQDAANDADGDGVCGDIDSYPGDPSRSGPLHTARLDVVDGQWQTVSLSAVYQNPVVIVGPPTEHDGEPGVVRIDDVTGTSFDIKFEEWAYLDGIHAPESVSYLVIEQGRELLADGSIWEAGTFAVSGTGSFTGAIFAEAFASTPALLLTLQSAFGNEPVVARARNLDGLGFEAAMFEEEALSDGHMSEQMGYLAIDSSTGSGVISLDGSLKPYLLQQPLVGAQYVPVLSRSLVVREEASLDAELGHMDELVSVLALGQEFFAQEISSDGWNTVSLRCREAEQSAPVEWGTIDRIDQDWQVVPLAKSYVNPVVVVKPASSRGSQAGVIRIRNKGSDSFEVRFQEWLYLDGNHIEEQVFYLVAEMGQHSLAGLTLEAGELNVATTQQSVAFGAAFATPPALFAAIESYYGDHPALTRIQDRSSSGFQIRLFEEEGGDGNHTGETVGWIAISPGNDTTSDGRAIEVLVEPVDDKTRTVSFAQSFAQRYPSVVADVSSTAGWDPCSVRFTSVDSVGVGLYLQEEQSLDEETGHVMEDVSLFVAE